MRYIKISWLWLLGLSLVACSVFAPTSTPVLPTVSAPETPALPQPSRTPVALPSPTPDGPALSVAGVRTFPAPLYSGDWVSFDVEPYFPATLTSATATVSITLPGGRALSAPVVSQGLDAATQARFYWAWQAAGLSGTQYLTVTLALPPDIADPNPTDNQVVFPLTLLPVARMWPPEPGAMWTVAGTTGFRLHYLTGSAAERDLPRLIAAAQDAYGDVTALLGAHLQDDVDIYLLDRVVGQGGYASASWVAVSYTDRLYPPVRIDQLLRHELTHRLDDALGCGQAPALIREGLAVYVAGGHYWPESLPLKAATLLQSGNYIPLETVAANFYTHQHEISYLEGGALITYIADEAGWEGVQRLCQAASTAEGTDSERLEIAVQAAVGAPDLAAFEGDWLRWLRALHPGPEDQLRLEAEWHLLETMRKYQARYDPAAHFLLGILFDPSEGQRLGITADFTRRPRETDPVALELLLIMAREALDRNDPARAQAVLAEVDAVLAEGFPAAGDAADVRAIAEAALGQGYDPYRLVYDAGQAAYWVYGLELADWPTQALLLTTRGPGGWQLLGPQPEH